MKIDGGSLQDLHHLALAIQGKECAFDSESLMDRLDAVKKVNEKLTILDRRVYEKLITRLDSDEPTVYMWDPYIKEVDSIKSVAELRTLGRRLYKQVLRVATEMGIDSYSGETIKSQTNPAPRTRT